MVLVKERITVKSYGEERPVEFGQDEKAIQKIEELKLINFYENKI